MCCSLVYEDRSSFSASFALIIIMMPSCCGKKGNRPREKFCLNFTTLPWFDVWTFLMSLTIIKNWTPFLTCDVRSTNTHCRRRAFCQKNLPRSRVLTERHSACMSSPKPFSIVLSLLHPVELEWGMCFFAGIQHVPKECAQCPVSHFHQPDDRQQFKFLSNFLSLSIPKTTSRSAAAEVEPSETVAAVWSRFNLDIVLTVHPTHWKKCKKKTGRERTNEKRENEEIVKKKAKAKRKFEKYLKMKRSSIFLLFSFSAYSTYSARWKINNFSI